MNANIQDEILEDIRFTCENFKLSKAHWSALSERHIGMNSYIVPEPFRLKGASLLRKFEKALTSKDIGHHNNKSHSVNKKFIVSLCSLMKDYKICERYTDLVTDQVLGIQGSEMVQICFNLRDRFEHPHGFRFEDVLKKQMLDHFGLKLEKGKKCPLPVETVIKSILDGCLKYIDEKLQVNCIEGSNNKDFLIIGTANGTMGGNVNLPQWL